MLLLANIWGFVYANWKYVLAGIAIVFLAMTVLYYCGKATAPKLNTKQIERGQQAVKENNDRELVEIFAEAEAEEKAIDANVSAGRVETLKVIQEAREKYSQMSRDELQAEFDRRK